MRSNIQLLTRTVNKHTMKLAALNQKNILLRKFAEISKICKSYLSYGQFLNELVAFYIVCKWNIVSIFERCQNLTQKAWFRFLQWTYSQLIVSKRLKRDRCSMCINLVPTQVACQMAGPVLWWWNSRYVYVYVLKVQCHPFWVPDTIVILQCRRLTFFFKIAKILRKSHLNKQNWCFEVKKIKPKKNRFCKKTI